jgi:hypothetical protein
MDSLDIVYVSMDEITPYENNPRMNDGAVESVAKSISEFGFKVPIVLDKDYVIVCGHTRYKAAKQLGLTEVPCVIAADLTPKQVKAFRLADNRVSDNSIWDNKKLLEELDDLDDIFTGFELSDVFDNTLDEKDNSALDDNEYGVTYEVVFRSENEEKIKRIQSMREQMEKIESAGEQSDEE